MLTYIDYFVKSSCKIFPSFPRVSSQKPPILQGLYVTVSLIVKGDLRSEHRKAAWSGLSKSSVNWFSAQRDGPQENWRASFRLIRVPFSAIWLFLNPWGLD